MPLILFLYVLIRDQIIWKGERFDHYLIYYKFILYIFFGSLALSFLNSKMKQNILLIIFSSYFSLLIVETMFHSVSFYEKIQKKILFKKFTKKRFNENTLYEEYIKLSKFDKVDLKVWPKFFLEKKTNIFPLSSISNSNILYCNENGYFLNYKTDKYGFNNDNKIWEQAKIDHLLLGDSFVEGACVSPSDNLASQLNKITNEAVLNLGQAGFGPLSQLGTYLEYVSTKNKKYILVLL